MKGFKDSTKVQYAMGGSCYAKGGSVKGAAKISKVMGEFKAGTLHSGSKKGPEVTNPKQATAIALSEARKAGAKIPVKKFGGGSMDKSMVEGTSSLPTVNGRQMTLDDMQRQATQAELDAVARGNRMAREETSESRLVRNTRKDTPRTREVTSEQRMGAKRDVRTPLIRNPLMDKLTQLPSQRGEFPVRRNTGGLAVMPRGKKGC